MQIQQRVFHKFIYLNEKCQSVIYQQSASPHSSQFFLKIAQHVLGVVLGVN